MRDGRSVDIDGIHEFGTDAHGREVSGGRYVVRQDGHIVLLQPHVPMKPGDRLAEPEDLDKTAIAEHERAGVERIAAAAAHEAARDRDHLAGELERAERELQADRAADKEAARNADKHVIAAGDAQHDADDFGAEESTGERAPSSSPSIETPASPADVPASADAVPFADVDPIADVLLAPSEGDHQ